MKQSLVNESDGIKVLHAVLGPFSEHEKKEMHCISLFGSRQPLKAWFYPVIFAVFSGAPGLSIPNGVKVGQNHRPFS